MKPLQKIYLLRVALGITAALICAGYGIVTGIISKTTFTFSTVFNGISIALIVYIISYYYIIKRIFILQVEKPQKLFTTGIGIYFITWLVFWILLYTIIAELSLTL